MHESFENCTLGPFLDDTEPFFRPKKSCLIATLELAEDRVAPGGRGRAVAVGPRQARHAAQVDGLRVWGKVASSKLNPVRCFLYESTK